MGDNGRSGNNEESCGTQQISFSLKCSFCNTVPLLRRLYIHLAVSMLTNSMDMLQWTREHSQWLLLVLRGVSGTEICWPPISIRFEKYGAYRRTHRNTRKGSVEFWTACSSARRSWFTGIGGWVFVSNSALSEIQVYQVT